MFSFAYFHMCLLCLFIFPDSNGSWKYLNRTLRENKSREPHDPAFTSLFIVNAPVVANKVESSMDSPEETKEDSKPSAGVLRFSLVQLPHNVASSVPLDPDHQSKLGEVVLDLNTLESDLRAGSSFFEKTYPTTAFNTELDISIIKAGSISSTQLFFDIRGVAGLFANLSGFIPQIVVSEVLPFSSHTGNNAFIPVGETECDDNGSGSIDPSGNVDFDSAVVVGRYKSLARILRVSLFACEVNDNEARVHLASANFPISKIEGDGDSIELDFEGFEGAKVVVWNGQRRKGPPKV